MAKAKAAGEKFAIGDIVRLKSGGPEMTVDRLPNPYNDDYTCQWFAGKKLEHGDFQPDALVFVDKESQ